MDYELKRPLCALFSAGDQKQKYANIGSELIFGDLSRKVPIITVLIPTYRRPEQLTDAVQSAIKQTIDKSKYEILIIENEYEHNGLSFLKVKAMNAENVFYYQNNQNLGAGGNWNRGFELARTEWICMLHDDDILYSHALEAICSTISVVDSRKTAAISPSFDFAHKINGEWVCEVPKSVRIWRKPLQNRLVRRSLLRLQLGLLDAPVAPTCGATFRKQAILNMGGFPDQYKSDDMFFLFALSVKYSCYKTNAVWGQYRWGDNDSQKESTKVELLKETLIVDNYFLTNPQKGILPMIERWFRKRLQYLICIYPFVIQIDSRQRNDFIEKYSPEWGNYKPTNIEKALFMTRRLMTWAYDMIATILSKKDVSYVKNQ